MEANKKRVLLVGNPNVGKSTIFNGLCIKKQKTGNYAGVTVASHSGFYEYKNEQVEIVDLPGSYSIYPNSEDEAVFSKYLIEEKEHYEGVIYVADAQNLRRSLLLFQQIRDYGIRVLMVINQIDEAERRDIKIDTEKLSEILDVEILTSNAKKNIGIEAVREAVHNSRFRKISEISFDIPLPQKEVIQKISAKTQEQNPYRVWTLLASEHNLSSFKNLNEILNESGKKCDVPKRLQVQETLRRYQVIDEVLSKVTVKKRDFKELLTEKLDKILVHKFWGYFIFVLVLLFIFQMVFYLAAYPMDWIENGTIWLSNLISEHLPKGPINSLISNGIIPGIGGIVVFAPQIGILLYFLYLLEDSGYMARVVFLMDRLLRPFGLNGKSIVPLVSGTACAIPAIMSTRNIENVKERLITILVTPFMTCSARLPVYSIIIGLIIPDRYFFGIDYKALALLAMYLLGFVTALFASVILKKFIDNKGKSFLVMAMPAYKMPLFGYDFKLMLEKVWGFITGAGKIIFVVSIIIWVFSYFGPSSDSDKIVSTDVELDHSYLAKMGKAMEPAIAPLGYDWKMGVGILTSFAAREVFVGTMSTLYRLDDDAPEEKVIEKMRRDVKPNGEKVFSFATGLSVMVFYAFAMQCISTIAVVVRETKSWKWAILQTIGMTGLAYLASLLVYQFFR